MSDVRLSVDDVPDLCSARLSEEASRIESLLTKAEVWKNEPDRVHQTLAQLYTLLRARSENASIASDTIDCSLDNIRAMRHLGINHVHH